MNDEIDYAREIINSIDEKMAKLFEERMHAVETVYKYKKKHGLPVQDEERENKVIEINTGKIQDEEIKGYYTEYVKKVTSLSRAYQYKLQNGLKVAYCGVEGAFAHIATGKIFPNAQAVSYHDFNLAYDAVVNGECDAVVLPIENSYAGEVGQVIDLIFSGGLYVNGIYELEICQNLLGIESATCDDIKKVISHPQALSQCNEYLKLREYEVEECSNTAVGAQMVARLNDKSVGAIASSETANLYGLKIIESNINKSAQNSTRFAVLSAVMAKKSSFNGSVLMFAVKNQAGSLANAISIIGKYGYNMTALRSRPMKKHSWQYYFYVEIAGSVDTDNGKMMLNELSAVCDKLKVVGAFARHTQI